MSAQWPSAVVTTSQLYVAVNELQNNLSGAISNAVTTIGLNSTTGFATVGLVLIDNEVIQYTGVSGNNLTGCTRAFDGTSAASHSSGAVVSYAFCAAHYNNAANEVIAVESYLDTVLGKGTSVTATEFAFVHGVTSAIQTQLNTKAPTASPTFTGTIGTALTISKALQTDASGNLQASSVTTTELGFVSGVTSAIQTQLNAKIANPLTSDLAAATHKLTGLGNISFDTPGVSGVVGCDGTTDASAGNVGEYVAASFAAVSVGSTGVYSDATSISLTAGDWNITYMALVNTIGVASVAQIDVLTTTTAGNSTTGATLGVNWLYTNPLSGTVPVLPITIANYRLKLTATTTVYAKIKGDYSGTAPKLTGGITARRMR